MHWPMTVMYTGPMATHTSAAMDQMLCATPLAAI